MGKNMSAFKRCTCCQSPWCTREEFLQDENTVLIGYQANFCQLELGYFLFNHLTCMSTLAIPAGKFKDLFAGPVFGQRLTDTDVCQGFCKDIRSLEPCEEKCACAYVREIMQIIRKWPKEAYHLKKIAQG